MYSMNEKCKTSNGFVKIPSELIEQIYKEGKCPIGTSCPPDTSECDHDGIVHCTSEPKLTLWSANRDYKFTTLHRRNKWTSSCVQDWDCKVSSEMAPLEVGYSQFEGIYGFVFDAEGKPMQLNGKTLTQSVNKEGTVTIAGIVKPEVETKIKLKCIQSQGRRMCIVPDGQAINKGTVFKVGKDCYGSSGNILVKTYCTGKLESSQLEKELGDKASLVHLKKVLNEVLFEQLQAQLNTLELARSINRLQEAMTTVVSELSRADPIFLGTYLYYI